MLCAHPGRARPGSCVGLMRLEPSGGVGVPPRPGGGGRHLSPACVAPHPQFQEPPPPRMKVEMRMGTAVPHHPQGRVTSRPTSVFRWETDTEKCSRLTEAPACGMAEPRY